MCFHVMPCCFKPAAQGPARLFPVDLAARNDDRRTGGRSDPFCEPADEEQGESTVQKARKQQYGDEDDQNSFHSDITILPAAAQEAAVIGEAR